MMARLLISSLSLVALLLVACDSGGCASDADCEGDRICGAEAGTCVSDPMSQEAPGRVVGHLYNEDPGDLGPSAYQVQVHELDGAFLLDQVGEPRLWNTRNLDAALPEGLDEERGVLGSFEVELPPGEYILYFDPVLNDRPQLLASISAPFTVEPGTTIVQDLPVRFSPGAMNPAGNPGECVDDRECDPGSLCTEGACVVDLEADEDLDGETDGVADGGPEGARGNCPELAELQQGDADVNGTGGPCDTATPGIGVRGVLDFSAQPGADPSVAQVFISGREMPVGIDEAGVFSFDNALSEPGSAELRVRWPGFEPLDVELEVPDGVPVFDAGTMVLTALSDG